LVPGTPSDITVIDPKPTITMIKITSSIADIK
jgi:hypothetical protein